MVGLISGETPLFGMNSSMSQIKDEDRNRVGMALSFKMSIVVEVPSTFTLSLRIGDLLHASIPEIPAHIIARLTLFLSSIFRKLSAANKSKCSLWAECLCCREVTNDSRPQSPRKVSKLVERFPSPISKTFIFLLLPIFKSWMCRNRYQVLTHREETRMDNFIIHRENKGAFKPQIHEFS